MKNLFIIVLVLFAFQVSAQVEIIETHHPDGKYAPFIKKEFASPKDTVDAGWFIPTWDLFDYFYGGYDMVSHYANLIFVDSTVVYESSGTTKANWLNSVGQVLDPYSGVFPVPLNAGDSYIIDSLFVLAWYNTVLGGVTDTLVAEFVYGDPTENPEFEHTIYIYTPDTLHVSPPAAYGDTTQVGYFAKLTAPGKIIIKYPLQTIDTTMQYGKYVQFPVNIMVPAWKVTGVSISFVPGYSYNFGDMLHSYSGTQTQVLNSFRVGLYSTDDPGSNPHLMYDPYEGYNLSFYMKKENRYVMYTGGDTWRNERMTSSVNWGFDIGWKLTKVYNPSVQFMQLDEAQIYPNPANDYLNIAGAENCMAYIYSTDGRLIETLSIDDKIQSISTSNYASGIYYLKLVNNDESKVFEFIKE